MTNGHGVKVCAKCKQEKPLEDFGRHLRRNRVPGKQYVNSRCRQCVNESWNASHARDMSLRRRYRITSEQFDTLLTEQGGCAACGSEETDGKYWHVDHDHSCCRSTPTCGKCLRGILCHGCNTALGNVGDSTERLALLIEYLERR